MSGTVDRRPHAWIEIDLSAIQANYEQVTALKPPDVRCMAVVKADGYGLGMEMVAQTLAQAGCDAFAVTTVEQGVRLRRTGIGNLILVLGPALPDEWDEALRWNLTLTLSQPGMLKAFEGFCAERKQAAEVHLKLETGMGRTGFLYEELAEAVPVLLETRHVTLGGVYTHFAQADDKKGRKETLAQFERFCQGVAYLREKGVETGLRHVCNSSAFLLFPQCHLDMVRIGTLLIGQVAEAHLAQHVTLRDPWTVKARVLQVRHVPAGSKVGYRGLYKTRSETKLAVIGLGYADGFTVEPRYTPRGLIDLGKILLKNACLLFRIPLKGGGLSLFLRGRAVGVAGKVGMELTVLDVGEGPCAVDDEVKVSLRRTTAGARLERVYVREGRRVRVRHLEDTWEESQEKTVTMQENA